MVHFKTQKEVFREISLSQKIFSGLFSLRIFFSGYKKFLVMIIPFLVFAIEIWNNAKSGLDNSISSFLFTKTTLFLLFVFFLTLFLVFLSSDKKYIKYLEHKLERCEQRKIVIIKNEHYKNVREEAFEQLDKRILFYKKNLSDFEFAKVNVLGI